MAIEIAVFELLAEPVRSAALEYAEYMLDLAGKHLQSLAFYGPVVDGRFDGKRMLAQNVAVLGDIDLELLRELAKNGTRFGKQRIAAPIIMTPEYIRVSLDTFPLELIEIQHHHVTVSGAECFQDLRFEAEHIRLQCERELKILLIGMRQGLLAAAGRERLLGQLEASAAESLLRTIRGMVWLNGETTAAGPEDLLSSVENLLDRKLNAVRAILRSESGKGWEQFVALYEDLEILREKADAW